MGISFGNMADQAGQAVAGMKPNRGTGLIDLPAQTFQMQPQQYTQMPYAQQYAQQGNINDPTVLAALQALNAPAYIAQPTQRYGGGIMDQPGAGKGGAPMIQDWRNNLPPPPKLSGFTQGLIQQDYSGGGDVGFGGDSGFGFDGSVTADSNVGHGSIGVGVGEVGAADPGAGGTAAGDTGGGSVGGGNAAGGAGNSGDGGTGDSSTAGGDGGGTKIICTAMNHAYGFGSFRNAIWIAYADKHLTKAHEVGYHTLFLPLVDFGFKRGDAKLNLAVRKILEWGTRHRSMDLRAEMRGTKRDATGRTIRFIFEPLCLAVGKLKGY